MNIYVMLNNWNCELGQKLTHIVYQKAEESR